MDDAQTSSFGALLRTFRNAAGLTQEELAERANLTTNAIGALERGERRRPQPGTVRALAAALHLAAGDQTVFAAAARAPLPAEPPVRRCRSRSRR